LCIAIDDYYQVKPSLLLHANVTKQQVGAKNKAPTKRHNRASSERGCGEAQLISRFHLPGAQTLTDNHILH
jgi:hypothetical protein